jgi:tetratricopeptide (TPR) repeat protein
MTSWRTDDVARWARDLDATLGLARPAIVLHTEVAVDLLSGGETAAGLTHLEIARRLAARLEPDTAFRRRWLLAAGALAQSRFEAPLALTFFDECRKAFPREAEAWLGAGTVYEWSAFPDGLGGPRVLGGSSSLGRDAVRAYRTALSLEPDLALARVRLGRVLARLGRREEARRELERAVRDAQDDSTRALAHLFLGEVREKQGRDEDALREYRAALGAEPGLQPAGIAFAALLVSRGERAQAIGALRQTVRSGCATSTPHWLAYHVGLGVRAEGELARLRQEMRS